MAIRKMICITCPRGCHLEVDDETLTVRGNTCEKGAEYGKNEVTNPRRVLTSTVKLEGGSYCRLPVKTAGAIPKGLLFDAMPVRAMRIGHSIQPFLTSFLAIRSKQTVWMCSAFQSLSGIASSTGISAVSASFALSGVVFIFLLT